MREILFRGRGKQKPYLGKWFYGELECYQNGGKNPIIWQNDNPYVHGYFVERETIGQYIGLTDKNGKRIFEGDIVTHPLTDTKGIVQWMDSGFVVHEPKHDEHGDYYYALNDGDKKTTVIGNIHDNPELMKGA